MPLVFDSTSIGVIFYLHHKSFRKFKAARPHSEIVDESVVVTQIDRRESGRSSTIRVGSEFDELFWQNDTLVMGEALYGSIAQI